MITRRQFVGTGSAAFIAGAAPRKAWGRTSHEVAIIGAGLAGLHAASLLEQAGLRCTVIEAESRVGGRLHTLDDLPGRPEAGGIQVGQGYTILRQTAARLDIVLDQSAGAGAGAVGSASALTEVRGKVIAPADWPTSTGNLLGEHERGLSPLALARHYAGALPQFDRPESWLDADPSLDVSYAEALRRAGASAEAQRLIDANMNGNSLAAMSAISPARTAAVYRAGPGPTMVIRGGSQRLPEAMAGALAGDVQTGHPVRAIREGPDAVEIVLDHQTVRARQAICTIPFASLRSVPVIADLPVAMAQMIGELPYTRASFAFLSARSAFWRDDGLPETIWSDDPLIGRVFVVSDAPPMLKLWTFGEGADLIDRMSPDRASTAIIPRIEAIRPSARGQLRLERLFSWQNRATARGIYHHIGTGQAAALAAATRHSGHRLHFAGEHLAQAATGMEGALESGARAAMAVLARS
ncbi:MAG: flavin monoamine oxidase family protein [Erythrobacter sp.]